MATGSAESALARIEAALARIDRAPQPPSSDAELRERHQRLRAATEQAMRRLDALLAMRRGED